MFVLGIRQRARPHHELESGISLRFSDNDDVNVAQIPCQEMSKTLLKTFI
jgi:hypothetical protein